MMGFKLFLKQIKKSRHIGWKIIEDSRSEYNGEGYRKSFN